MNADWAAEVREIMAHAEDEAQLRDQLDRLCSKYEDDMA